MSYSAYSRLYFVVSGVNLVVLVLAAAVKPNYDIFQFKVDSHFLHAKLAATDQFLRLLPKLGFLPVEGGWDMRFTKLSHGI